MTKKTLSGKGFKASVGSLASFMDAEASDAKKQMPLPLNKQVKVPRTFKFPAPDLDDLCALALFDRVEQQEIIWDALKQYLTKRSPDIEAARDLFFKRKKSR